MIWDELDLEKDHGVSRIMREALQAEERGERIPYALRTAASELNAIQAQLVSKLLRDISRVIRREGRDQDVREIDGNVSEWRTQFAEGREVPKT